mmetsp:Transcript_1687/g.5436  ORF Transcript_1687/g.5436 Transcript_1687/m.5436 type:complete len:274 (-) Transcript_1687:263-1084(-)
MTLLRRDGQRGHTVRVRAVDVPAVLRHRAEDVGVAVQGRDVYDGASVPRRDIDVPLLRALGVEQQLDRTRAAGLRRQGQRRRTVRIFVDVRARGHEDSQSIDVARAGGFGHGGRAVRARAIEVVDVLRQQTEHVRVTGPRGDPRGVPPFPRRRVFGPGFQQQRDHVDVPALRRDPQGRHLLRALVDVRAGIDEDPKRVDVARYRGRASRGRSVDVRAVDVAGRLQKNAEHVSVAPVRGDKDRRLPVDRRRFRVRARGEEQLDRVDAPGEGVSP